MRRTSHLFTIMRIMGIDVGTKRIGIALSDETGILAQGKEIIERKNDHYAIEQIKKIIEEYKVSKIIVGLPLNMRGDYTESTLNSVKFSEMIKKEISLPTELWDERLSTKEVEDVMIEASVTRRKRKKVLDKLAAQIILQGYLDSLRNK